MLHSLFIAIHAAAGVLAAVAGSLLVCRPGRSRRQGRLTQAYLAALGLLVVGLVGALAVSWSEKSSAERTISSVLVVLAVAMLVRAGLAVRLWRTALPGWQADYIDHIGFTLICLLDGFVIVGAADLDAPGWVVAAVAVAGILAGIQAVGTVKRRVVPAP